GWEGSSIISMGKRLFCWNYLPAARFLVGSLTCALEMTSLPSLIRENPHGLPPSCFCCFLRSCCCCRSTVPHHPVHAGGDPAVGRGAVCLWGGRWWRQHAQCGWQQPGRGGFDSCRALFAGCTRCGRQR